jgi:hypothetical protein
MLTFADATTTDAADHNIIDKRRFSNQAILSYG